MVRIRLRRTGRKRTPTYRIVVADSQSPRDGRFIEIIGQYAPRQGETALNLDRARANYWLDNGAQPSDTVRSLIKKNKKQMASAPAEAAPAPSVPVGVEPTKPTGAETSPS